MFNGSGWMKCPASNNCNTLIYRGSSCSVLRSKLNLGDPKTQFDDFIFNDLKKTAEKLVVFYDADKVYLTTDGKPFTQKEDAIQHELDWLYSPCGKEV